MYLVGMLDRDGSPETNDYEHIPPALLFAVEHEVAPDMRAARKKRFDGYLP